MSNSIASVVLPPGTHGGELHALLLVALLLYHFELSAPDAADPPDAPDAPDGSPDAGELDKRSTFTAVAGGLPLLFARRDLSREPPDLVLV